MSRRLFADLPSSADVAAGGNSRSRKNADLWPIGTAAAKLMDVVDAITDSEPFQRAQEIKDSAAPYCTAAWAFLTSASWIVSTSFLVIGKQHILTHRPLP